MKIRSCFVSNSSSSSFVLDAASIEEAKEAVAECIAKFLDQKATHERHLQQAREFLEDRIRLDKIVFFRNDGSIPFKELSELLWTGSPESVLTESDRGKVVMVDHEKDSIASWYADCETWAEDEDAIASIFKEAGIESR